MTDVIDSLVGIAPGSKLDAIRAQRSEARTHAQALQEVKVFALHAAVNPCCRANAAAA